MTACSISISCRQNSDANAHTAADNGDADACGFDAVSWARVMRGQEHSLLWRIDRVEKGSVMAYSRSSIIGLCTNPLSSKWRRLLVESPSPAPTFSPCVSSSLPPDVHINPSQAAAIALCLAAQDYCLVQHPFLRFQPKSELTGACRCRACPAQARRARWHTSCASSTSRSAGWQQQ